MPGASVEVDEGITSAGTLVDFREAFSESTDTTAPLGALVVTLVQIWGTPETSLEATDARESTPRPRVPPLPVKEPSQAGTWDPTFTVRTGSTVPETETWSSSVMVTAPSPPSFVQVILYTPGVMGFVMVAPPRMTVPEQPPFVFASVAGGTVEIFFNDAATAIKEYPAFAGRPIGATGTLFIEVQGIDALHDRLKNAVPIVMPLVTQFYGMREFAIADPDGYVITFAEPVRS